MKKTLLLLTIFLISTLHCFSQNEGQINVLFSGMYIAKTGGVPAANIEFFTYLLFYDDGKV